MENAQGGYRVLIADDDVNVHQSLSVYFKREGYQIISQYDGDGALSQALAQKPDIVILDIMMPKMDGIQVCREIRKQSTVPIIMLSARGEEIDKLLGLELGADDYVTKPFSPREVVARVKTVLRRLTEVQRKDDKAQRLTIANLEISLDTFTVKVGGSAIACTPKEIEILFTLASNPNIVFSRDNLLQSIWGYDFMGETRAVDSHIKRIRAKLSAPDNGWDIRTVWGVGYRFEVDQ